MTSGDERDRDERPRVSWSEIDKRRDRPRERREARRPRGAAAEARSRAAAQEYVKQLDAKLFAKGARGGAAGARRADAVRAALGTPALPEACRAYLAEVGAPSDPPLIAAFLDTRDRTLQLAALRALCEGVREGRLSLSGGLRAQVRTLAEGLDDALAAAAEEALAGG